MRNLKDCWNRPKTGRGGRGVVEGRWGRWLTTSALCAPVDGHRLWQPGAYSFLIRDNQTPCPFRLQKGQRSPIGRDQSSQCDILTFFNPSNLMTLFGVDHFFSLSPLQTNNWVSPVSGCRWRGRVCSLRFHCAITTAPELQKTADCCAGCGSAACLAGGVSE